MILPSQMTVRCYADDAPAACLFVLLTLRARRKNDFNVTVGPTEQNGALVVSREHVERDVQRQAGLFAMDYTGLADLTGEVVFQPMDEAALDKALAAYALYAPYFRKQQTDDVYSPDYEGLLRTAKQVLARLSPKRLSVDVEYADKDVTIWPVFVTLSRPANSPLFRPDPVD